MTEGSAKKHNFSDGSKLVFFFMTKKTVRQNRMKIIIKSEPLNN